MNPLIPLHDILKEKYSTFKNICFRYILHLRRMVFKFRVKDQRKRFQVARISLEFWDKKNFFLSREDFTTTTVAQKCAGVRTTIHQTRNRMNSMGTHTEQSNKQRKWGGVWTNASFSVPLGFLAMNKAFVPRKSLFLHDRSKGINFFTKGLFAERLDLTTTYMIRLLSRIILLFQQPISLSDQKLPRGSEVWVSHTSSCI